MVGDEAPASNHGIKVNTWAMVFFLTLLPLLGIVGTSFYVYFNGVVWQEPILLLLFWFISGMGITMGYHRLFSHKSYQTNVFVEWVLMIFGSLALENTILKWSSDHRKHHSKPESEEDPYSITKGFWYAHIGWVVENTDEEKNKIIAVKDLEKKSAVRFQSKYYLLIAIIGGFIVPFLIGLSFGRPLGAVLWGSFLRITLVHHATFFINSLCHFVGKKTYDSDSTARDSWVMSLFTFGEGYHNYHHKFPSDFRNGVSWFAFDPSKWFINILSIIGFTKNLRKTKEYLIFKSKLDSLHKTINTTLISIDESHKVFYEEKITKLIKSANEIINDWKESDKSIADNLTLKKYKSELKRIYKDLSILSKNLEKGNLVFPIS